MGNGSIRLHPKHGVNPTLEVCTVCGSQTGALLLLGYNGNKEAEKYTNVGNMCSQCKTVLESGGVVITEATGPNNAPMRTGRFVGLAKTASLSITIKKSMGADPEKGMVAMMKPDLFEKMFGECDFKKEPGTLDTTEKK